MFQDSQVWIGEQAVAKVLSGYLGTCLNLATSTNMPCLPYPHTVGWGSFWRGLCFCPSCCHPQLLSHFLLGSSLPVLSPYGTTLYRLSLRGCLKPLTYQDLIKRTMLTWRIRSLKSWYMISPCLDGDRSLHREELCSEVFSWIRKDSPNHSSAEFLHPFLCPVVLCDHSSICTLYCCWLT